MVTVLRLYGAESVDSVIYRENESYRGLPTSWVVPGIGVADEKLKVDPAEEYLLPRDRYDTLDELLESDPDSDEELNRKDRIEDIGHSEMLKDLDPGQIQFVKEYAESGSIDSAAALVGIGEEQRLNYFHRISEIMEGTMRRRRENSQIVEE